MQSQCPPDVTTVFVFADRTINLPLTVPLCIACRFIGTMGDRIQFSDGIWRDMGGAELTNGSFNGNVTLSSTSDTTAITLTYPEAVIEVGDMIRCVSASIGRLHVITIGGFSKQLILEIIIIIL